MISDSNISSRVDPCYSQQVDKATLAVGDSEGTDDTIGCCRGGDSEQRYRFDGLSTSRPFKCGRTCFASGTEEARAKIARIEK